MIRHHCGDVVVNNNTVRISRRHRCCIGAVLKHNAVIRAVRSPDCRVSTVVDKPVPLHGVEQGDLGCVAGDGPRAFTLALREIPAGGVCD